jgi:hypothetical protein
MSEPIRKNLMCVHGDDKHKCPFCVKDTQQEVKKKAAEKELKQYNKILNKKRTKLKLDETETKRPLTKMEERMIDQIVDLIKETEWPDWAELADWRMVSVNAIEKHFGRV